MNAKNQLSTYDRKSNAAGKPRASRFSIQIQILFGCIKTAAIGALLNQCAFADQSEGFGIEEIVVTASKREVLVHNLGMSVAALNVDTLDNMGAESFEDFATSVANLSFGFGGAGDGRNARSFAIRGISGPRTTGFYVDETPLPNFVDPRLVDIARVEVLRGPQGSLYGASSLGGTVRLISNQPNVLEIESLLDVSVSHTKEGSDNHQFEGVINLPFFENRAALRLAAYLEKTDGAFDRVFPDSANPTVSHEIENVDNTDLWGIQASVQLNPSERLSVTTKLAHHEHQSNGTPWTSELGAFDQVRLFDIAESLDDKWNHGSLTIKYTLDQFELLSVTSYFERDFIEFEDVSEVVAVFFGGFQFPSHVDQIVEEERITQEVRLSSTHDGRMQYLVGAFFSDIDTSSPSTTILPGFEASFAEFIGAPGAPVFGGTDVVFNGVDDFSTREYALFGELSFELTEKLSLTAGARWFHVELARFTLNTGIIADGNTTLGDDTETGLNPKFLLDYELKDSISLYTSISKGYRHGGISGFIPLFCGADVAAPATAFNSDSLWSYELGTKTQWLNNKLSVNAALFHIDWDDVQQRREFPCGFGQTVNAGKARSQGFELELAAAPSPNLTITAGVGYANSEIRSTEAGILPRSGDRLLQVPEWTANVSINYRYNLPFVDNAYFHVNYAFVGNSVTKFSNDPVYSRASAERGAYNLWHVNTSIERNGWNASLFVQNLFNEHANLSEALSLAAEVPGLERYVTNTPRTIGLRLKKNI